MYTLSYGAHVGDMSLSNRKGLKQEKKKRKGSVTIHQTPKCPSQCPLF